MLLNERFQFWFRVRGLQPPGVCFSVVFNQDFIGVEATCLCVYLGCLRGGGTWACLFMSVPVSQNQHKCAG